MRISDWSSDVCSSALFQTEIVATDPAEYASITRHYGAEVPCLRPPSISGHTSPDIAWVRFALDALAAEGRGYDAFSILRPTSPFRKAATIRRAWDAFLDDDGGASPRAVEKCGQHPAKMGILRGHRLHPLLPIGPAEQRWHSSAYDALPDVHFQNT